MFGNVVFLNLDLYRGSFLVGVFDYVLMIINKDVYETSPVPLYLSVFLGEVLLERFFSFSDSVNDDVSDLGSVEVPVRLFEVRTIQQVGIEEGQGIPVQETVLKVSEHEGDIVVKTPKDPDVSLFLKYSLCKFHKYICRNRLRKIHHYFHF